MTKQVETTTLVADIGGTHSRFALAHLNGHSKQPFNINQLEILPTAGFASLETAAASYLQKIVHQPKNAVIAVAAPVIGGHVKFSNCAWESCTESLQRTLGLNQVSLLNDFAAIANAIPYLNDESVLQIGSGEKKPQSPMVVLGPGTGMGVAALVSTGQQWLVIPGEGGHIGFAPADELEIEILKVLLKQYDRISVERLLSGSGLAAIHSAIGNIEKSGNPSLTPEAISEHALNGTDMQCIKALNVFCSVLGSFAGDIAMVFNATGGVYLAGGILPKIQNFVVNSHFRERFEDKNRVSFIRQVPTYQIVEQQPALIGAAAWATQRFSS